MRCCGPWVGKVHTGVAYADAKKEGAVLGYGAFITALLNFLIIAAVLFMVIQAMNRLTRKEKAVEKPAEPSAELKMLTDIRDLLARK